MSEYEAQLLAVETKLVKDPDNEELLALKSDLLELLELSKGLEEEEEEKGAKWKATNRSSDSSRDSSSRKQQPAGPSSSSSKIGAQVSDDGGDSALAPVDRGAKRPFSEAELLAKKKEKNRKKKAKLRERIREQLDVAESEKQSWQSFANKKGLRGITKKSIFASPCSVTGKVGVGTNGIADAPSAAALTIARKKLG